MIDDELLATTVHDAAVRRLQYAYADVVNRRAWAELEELFLADAPVVVDRRAGEPLRLVGGLALGEFIGASVAQFEFFEFVILNAHVVFPDGPGAGTAVARMYMCELRQDGASGSRSTAFGVYHDRYVLRSGRWWFAERAYHSLGRGDSRLEVFPFPDRVPFDVPGAGR